MYVCMYIYIYIHTCTHTYIPIISFSFYVIIYEDPEAPEKLGLAGLAGTLLGMGRDEDGNDKQ